MKSLVLVSLTLFVSFMSLDLWAGPFRLGKPGYGGAGCPAGSGSIVLSPSEDLLVATFDHFATEAGGGSVHKLDRKACNIAVPIQVQDGYSVALSDISVNGFNNLSRGAHSRIEIEPFWTGAGGKHLIRDFTGPLDSSFEWKNTMDPVVWTSCGGSTNFRLNISIVTEAGAGPRASSTGIDGLKDIRFRWRRCSL